MTFKDLLIHHEGLKLKPYRCTKGYLTIGVGRNLDGKGLTKEEKIHLGIPPRNIMDGITKEEALYLLDNDIKAVINAVRETFSWFDDLNNVRQAVVCDMVFNLGLGKFLMFKNTIRSIILAIKDGNWTSVIKGMKDSDWYKQVGIRAEEDIAMMESGNAIEIRGL